MHTDHVHHNQGKKGKKKMINLTKAEKKHLRYLLVVNQSKYNGLKGVHPYAHQITELDEGIIKKIDEDQPPKKKSAIDRLDEELEAGRDFKAVIDVGPWQLDILEVAILKLKTGINKADDIETTALLAGIDSIEALIKINKAKHMADDEPRQDGYYLEPSRAKWIKAEK